jgi:hypothetical protein
MKRLLIAALIAAGPAMADDLVATNGRDSVRLTQATCHAEVLPLVVVAFPQVADRFRAARSRVAGTDYAACWILRPDGKVLLMYSDGDAGLVPAEDFKRVPGA